MWKEIFRKVYLTGEKCNECGKISAGGKLNKIRQEYTRATCLGHYIGLYRTRLEETKDANKCFPAVQSSVSMFAALYVGHSCIIMIPAARANIFNFFIVAGFYIIS